MDWNSSGIGFMAGWFWSLFVIVIVKKFAKGRAA